MRNESYIFLIHTDSYAGNFEREMCAYSTGRIGECEVGEEEASNFKREFDETICEDFANIIESRPDDGGCWRPCEMWDEAGKNEYHSVAIFFLAKPSAELVQIMKNRSEEFADCRGINIHDYSLFKEVVERRLEQVL